MTQEPAGGKLPRPPRSRRWGSFVADVPDDRGDGNDGKPVRSLHDAENPKHRLRVEHDPCTLLIHLSGEDGAGWTTIAVDRETRQWAVAQHERQSDAAHRAYNALYEPQRPQDSR